MDLTINIVLYFVAITIAFLAIMLLVAATVLAERRVLALLQGRLGPNRVGFGGILQPLAGARHGISADGLPGGLRLGQAGYHICRHK